MSNAADNRRKQPLEGQVTANPENICHAQRIDLKFDQSGRINHSRKHAMELSLTETPDGICFVEVDLNICISNRPSVLEGSFVEYVQHKAKLGMLCKKHASVFSLLPVVILPEMATVNYRKMAGAAEGATCTSVLPGRLKLFLCAMESWMALNVSNYKR